MDSEALLTRLLQPIGGPEAGPAACGEDLSFSAEFDTIAEMRREDDPSLPLGEWKEKGKEPKTADWAGLCRLCETLLAERSKDLRLAAWLADGWTQQRGLAGLADGFRLSTALVTQYWSHVHPLPEGADMDQRIGALNWLLGRVTLLVRVCRESGRPAPRRADAAAALQALAALQQVVDAQLGADGPGFVAAREALKALLADLPAESGTDPEAPGAADPGAAPRGDAAAAWPGGPPQTRAQALQQLRQVADFFRRTEPHSPVAYLADKAALWGTMDLPTWLRTVVKDGGALAQLEELLGTEPPRQH